jgi:multiple sugar transport system permease protein
VLEIKAKPRVWFLPKSRRKLLPFLFILPWLIGITFFYGYPILSSVYFSLTQYDVLTRPIWVGLRNYQELFQDEYFIQSVSNTIIFVSVSLPFGLMSGFLQALLLNEKIRGRGLFRGLILVPNTLPVAVIAAVWVYIWNPDAGLINSLLRSFGLNGQNWLVTPDMVKWVFIFITIWQGTGMMIFLAALQAVPLELFDAAKVDGAGLLQRFYVVTFPAVTPALLLNILTGLIGAFQYFAIPMLMTKGGPLGGSTFYSQYIYQSAFINLKMGYASAEAWLLFLVCGVIVYFIFRSSARWVYYEAE